MGPWRRALSDYDVRVQVIPWLAGAGVEQGAFEVLIAADPGGQVTEHAPDAGRGVAMMMRERSSAGIRMTRASWAP